MSENRNYSNREIDGFLNNLQSQLDRIEMQVKITNGKIKKITIALVFAFGLIIGLGSTNFTQVIQLLF